MSQNQARTGSAVMRPRARLIALIGDELISDEAVALVELVKNAYDADADKVEVRFEGTDPLKPERIIVEDDGTGMDVETVLGCWFEPGTVSKRRHTRSRRGRPWLGAKGIGRFAAARLAEALYLESSVEGNSDSVFVILNWGRFTDESYLDEIGIDYELRRGNPSEHGTVLTLETLRKTDWAEEDYERLHARLARLISPFSEVSDFRVVLDVPGYPQFSGDVQPPDLILKPKYFLGGTIDAAGTFTGKIKLDGRTHKTFASQRIGAKGAEPLCGPFQIEVRAWDRDRQGLDPLASRLGLSISEIRRTLNRFCGVSIYRDGFRIHPYGETGNDWLNLDNRSRQYPRRNLANNQIIAALRISRDENPALRDRSTREGMVLNDAHRDLETWFRNALSLLEEVRYRARRPAEPEDGRVEPLFESFSIGHATKAARKELGSAHPVSQLLSDTEKQVLAGVERVQEVFSRLLMSSGLGHMVDIVIHEIAAPLGKINRQIAIVERDMEKRCDPKGREHFLPKVTSIKAWLEQIHALRARLDPQTPAKRGRATSFPVHEELEDNFQLYQALLDKQRITWRIEKPREPIRVRMCRASLGQIIVNLIDNSIYWLVDSKGSGNGGKICVELRRLPHGFRIRFADDGPGVPTEDQSRIFEPYFSTKRGGSGMGLGLYISRLVIEPYGKITYRDTQTPLPGACFELRFERKVGR